jgi:hypothetical protein
MPSECSVLHTLVWGTWNVLVEIVSMAVVTQLCYDGHRHTYFCQYWITQRVDATNDEKPCNSSCTGTWLRSTIWTKLSLWTLTNLALGCNSRRQVYPGPALGWGERGPCPGSRLRGGDKKVITDRSHVIRSTVAWWFPHLQTKRVAKDFF